eukprot:scaffold257_cov422-Prasinococcus_capsulatus_cf.AAC.3
MWEGASKVKGHLRKHSWGKGRHASCLVSVFRYSWRGRYVLSCWRSALGAFLGFNCRTRRGRGIVLRRGGLSRIRMARFSLRPWRGNANALFPRRSSAAIALLAFNLGEEFLGMTSNLDRCLSPDMLLDSSPSSSEAL